jgi:transcriptional regulator of arginine metabolism
MHDARNFMQVSTDASSDWSVWLLDLTEIRSSIMAAELHQSSLRRAAIAKIIRESVVHKQEELVKLLKKQGFDATQSSVSRDLRELQVAKAGDRYIVPEGAVNRADPFSAISGFVTDVRTAGSALTVVKTRTGTAQSVAVAIDQAEWPEVVGTISGDDTIFIATDDGKAQQQLSKRLRLIFRL